MSDEFEDIGGAALAGDEETSEEHLAGDAPAAEAAVEAQPEGDKPKGESPVGDDLGKVPGYQGEPYTFDGCTITFSMAWLPLKEGDAARKILLGVRTHQDTPLAIRLVSEPDLDADGAPLGKLPGVIGDLLNKVRQEMPKRAELAQKGKRQPKATIIIENKAAVPSPAAVGKPAPTAAEPAASTKAGQIGLFDLFNGG